MTIIKEWDVLGKSTVLKVMWKEDSDKVLMICSCGQEYSMCVSSCLRSKRERRKSSCLHCQNKKHWMFWKRTYWTWQSMKTRCENKNHIHYLRYWWCWITVCEEWKDFEVFLKEMWECPSGKHSLDRINNNLWYYKENCKRSTAKEQANNRKNNDIFHWKTISQWSEFLSIPRSTVKSKVKNWTFFVTEDWACTILKWKDKIPYIVYKL